MERIFRTITLSLIALALLGLGLQGGENRPPEASFSFEPGAPTINDWVSFDGTASRDPDGQIVRYEWDFDGDGRIDLATEFPKARWIYDEPGPHAAFLRVTDDDGASGTTQMVVEVQDAPVLVRQELKTSIAPNRVLPGDTFQVTVMITAHTEIHGLGLQAELPEGWKLWAVENDGAAFKKREAQWLWVQGLLSGDRKRVTYEVTVPGDARPGVYTITGFVQSFSPRFKIPIPKDLEVQVL